MHNFLQFILVVTLALPALAKNQTSSWHSNLRSQLKEYKRNELLSDTTFVTDNTQSFEAILFDSTHWKKEDKQSMNNRQKADWEKQGFKFRGREKVNESRAIRYRTLVDKDKATYVMNEFYFERGNRSGGIVAISKLDKENQVLKVKKSFQSAFEGK